MRSTVETILKKFDCLNKTLVVGFSGGYDSLCLLDVVAQLSKEYGFEAVAAHLNHNWRAAEAKAEQRRCEDIAQKLGVKFITQTLEPDAKMTENDGRIARYEFFENCAKRFNDAVVLTAHNSDDNVETLVYRLIKGTGIKGLCGIPEFIVKNGTTFVRPLLKVSRDEIEKYCDEKGLIPNSDSSNADLKYKRNFIRCEILPMFKEINPKYDEAINSLSEVALENEQIIDELVFEVFENDKIIKKKFESLKPGLQQRAVHRFLVKAGVEYDRKRVLDVLSYISKRKKYSLTTNLYLVSDDEYIYATQNKEKNTEETAINENGRYKTFNGGELELLPAEEGMKFPKETDLSALVDLSRVSKELVLRTRRDGDVITPFGMNGKMKLKKYLISKKVPVQKRDELPILAQGNEALWVVGVGISEKLRVAKLPTNVVKYKY